MDENDTMKELGRLIAGGYYDYQETRISASNRLRSIIRAKAEGLDRSTPEAKKKEKEYAKKYTDANITALLLELVDQKLITTEEAQYLKNTYMLLEESKKLEDRYKKEMVYYIEQEQIYSKFLKGIKGIGPVLAANMIKEFGYCEPSTHASGLWKLCGLHVVDGKCVKRQKGVKMDYSPRCKTIAYLIGDMFIKHRTPVYRDAYDREKTRQLSLMEHALCDNCGKTPDKHKFSDGKYMCPGLKKGDKKTAFEFTRYYAPMNRMHCDLRARRKSVKLFLEHYWVTAREMKGLPVNKPYPFSKLGHDEKHYIKPAEQAS